MYRCQITGKMSKLGEKLNKIVVEKRPKQYKTKIFNEDTRKMEEIIIGEGWEIAREINASDEGARLWELMSEEEQNNFVARGLLIND